MEYAYLIVGLALAQYMFFTFRTGVSRPKLNVDAPKTVGNETWERLFRVQQNTLEQLIIFIPSMLIFATLWSSLWSLIPGIGFILGRHIYSAQYLKDPATRAPGMLLSFLANAILIVGVLAGVISSFLK